MKPDLKTLKRLIAEGKLKEAMEMLQDRIDDNTHLNYLIIQSARYHEIERAINMNVVNWDNANIEKSQITKSVLELIDEIEADENEEQKYLTDEDEKKLGIKAIYNKLINTNTDTAQENQEVEGIVLKFLKDYNKWYFSPLRIQKWGATQRGFGDLSQYTSDTINNVLDKLLKEGKIKKTSGKNGNPIYKIINQLPKIP